MELDDLVRACRHTFDQIAKCSEPLTLATHGVFNPHESTDSVDDASARFDLWAGNSGAAHSAADPRSLTYKLRDAAAIRSRINDILSELITHLHACESNLLW